MNAEHHKTLAAIFADPASGTIPWASIEALLVAVGAEVIEGHGSRMRFRKAELDASFHRPHLHKEAKPYQVRDARRFLVVIGVTP